MHRFQIVVVLSLLAFSLPACFDGAGERQEYAANGPMLQVLGTLQDGVRPTSGATGRAAATCFCGRRRTGKSCAWE